MERRVQRGTRWAALVAMCAVMASGCQWLLPAYGPSGTRNNDAEHTIGVAQVPTLTASWTGALGSSIGTTAIPVVASNVLVTATDGRLVAFAANGSRGCTAGALPACTPIWTSAPGPALRQPIISGDRVLALTVNDGLRVYDLAGVTGCSGSPVTCLPVGIVPGLFGSGLSAADGRIYVSGGSIASFDRATLLACAAASQPCAPGWESEDRFDGTDVDGVAGVAIDGGVVYALAYRLELDGPDRIDVRAFDLAACEAAGSCWPTWRSAMVPGTPRSIAVAEGMVVVSNDTWHTGDPESADDVPAQVLAYPAASCAASTEVCLPAWTAANPSGGHLAIAAGVVYVPVADGTLATQGVRVYDLDGATGCTGAPRVCDPIRTLIDPANGLQGQAPVVANGVVHLGPDAWATDASAGCSGSPVVCTPLRSGGTDAEAIVVNGRVHLQQTPIAGTAKMVTQTPA